MVVPWGGRIHGNKFKTPEHRPSQDPLSYFSMFPSSLPLFLPFPTYLLCLWAALKAGRGDESLLLVCQVCWCKVGVCIIWPPLEAFFFNGKKHIPWDSNSHDLKQFGQRYCFLCSQVIHFLSHLPLLSNRRRVCQRRRLLRSCPGPPRMSCRNDRHTSC